MNEIIQHFECKLEQYGPCPQGVDWNGDYAQTERFNQLAKIFTTAEFSLIDYGCGYGAFVDYLKGLRFTYTGVDISEKMLEVAKARHPEHTWAKEARVPADYVVASGLFGFKGSADSLDWRDYVFETLDTLNNLSIRGFSFNMITNFCDPDKMRDDLYYADPTYYFNYCKTKYSKQVALLHDYPLYDFTILVRK